MKIVLGKNKNIDFVCITAGGVTGTLKAIKASERNLKVCSFDDTETTRKAMLNGDILATVYQQPFEPVSYTHLDVYKRQVQLVERRFTRCCKSRCCNRISPSYMHGFNL